MTKIKNFRITLRPREIARLLKSHENLQITPALEASIEHTINDAKRSLSPAALYTTLAKQTAEKVTPFALPPKAVAFSVLAVTIGAALEEQRLSLKGHDPLQDALLKCVQQEALAQSLSFAVRLIQGQAKEEECELSAALPVQEKESFVALAGLLGVSRIGITPTAEGAWPEYTRLATLVWTPLKGATKKSEAAAKPAKVAV